MSAMIVSVNWCC